MWYFTKMDNWKIIGQERCKKQKELKVMTLEVKIKSSISEVIEEIAHSGNADIVAKRLWKWSQKNIVRVKLLTYKCGDVAIQKMKIPPNKRFQQKLTH